MVQPVLNAQAVFLDCVMETLWVEGNSRTEGLMYQTANTYRNCIWEFQGSWLIAEVLKKFESFLSYHTALLLKTMLRAFWWV